MELSNEIAVAASPDDAWAFLTDLPAFAACFPGLELRDVEAGQQLVTVRVRVGQSTSTFRGTADLVEADQSSGRIVLRISGNEVRGDGGATVSAVADVSPDGGAGGAGARVVLTTSVAVTGRLAEADAEVLEEAIGRIVGRFAGAVESAIGAGGVAGADADSAGDDDESGAPASGEADAGAAAPAADADESEAVLDRPVPLPPAPKDPGGPSLRRRLLPYASVAGALFLTRIIVYALRRRKK